MAKAKSHLVLEVPRGHVVTPESRYQTLAMLLTLFNRASSWDRETWMKHLALEFGYRVEKIG